MATIDNSVDIIWTPRNYTIETGSIDGDPLVWVSNRLPKDEATLLAHFHDGVNWASWDGSTLTTSYNVAPEIAPEWRSETLQELRAFTEYWEVYVWCEPDSSRYRIIADEPGEASISTETFDEQYLLWGTKATPQALGFSLLEDGSQGLRHVIPLRLEGIFLDHRVSLTVRHYLAEHENGVQTIALSRLVDIKE